MYCGGEQYNNVVTKTFKEAVKLTVKALAPKLELSGSKDASIEKLEYVTLITLSARHNSCADLVLEYRSTI